jgi:dolichol-phosphate mannosyltransferase
VLVIDDNSPDGTGELADALKATRPRRIEVIHRPFKQGLGTAYLTGFKHALGRGYDYVFQMDADFSHRPEDLPRLVAALDQGADLALGSRYVDGGRTIGRSALREMISRGGSRYAGLVLGLPFKDLTGGFKGYRREALSQLDLEAVRSSGFSFQIETTYQLAKKGLKIVEVPIEFADRRAGKSKMNGKIMWEALWVVWRLRLSSAGEKSPWTSARQKASKGDSRGQAKV